jgi:hypothetical protein
VANNNGLTGKQPNSSQATVVKMLWWICAWLDQGLTEALTGLVVFHDGL